MLKQGQFRPRPALKVGMGTNLPSRCATVHAIMTPRINTSLKHHGTLHIPLVKDTKVKSDLSDTFEFEAAETFNLHPWAGFKA